MRTFSVSPRSFTREHFLQCSAKHAAGCRRAEQSIHRREPPALSGRGFTADASLFHFVPLCPSGKLFSASVLFRQTQLLFAAGAAQSQSNLIAYRTGTGAVAPDFKAEQVKPRICLIRQYRCPAFPRFPNPAVSSRRSFTAGLILRWGSVRPGKPGNFYGKGSHPL